MQTGRGFDSHQLHNQMNSPIAKWWEIIEGTEKVLCTLCPRYCKIGDGQRGFCFIRKNIDGTLYQEGYGKVIGLAVDPIEKKPLNHFLPSSTILSFGTAGCNLGCKFCQNWHMSKVKDDNKISQYVTPEQIVKVANDNGCKSIAYTYNEPIIFGEFIIEVSKLARQSGLKNVMVTNGYITKEAREEVFQYIDAANVDLKAFTETFYHNLTYSHLEDVLDTIKWLYNETDVWIELTNLIIPTHNDNRYEIIDMINWILENCSDKLPLHFTAFHPDFKMKDLPSTPQDTLNRAREIAMDMGMKYVYTGNVSDSKSQTTYCPQCKSSMISRIWHSVIPFWKPTCDCGYKLEGVFK